jgi:hypothetical protein
MVRTALALIAVAAASALGALILGEYEFTGTLPWVAGPLFGLVMGEISVAIDKGRSLAQAVLTAALAFGGIAWAGWIDSTDGVAPMRPIVWASAVLAGAVAFLRVRGLGARRSTPPPTEPV